MDGQYEFPGSAAGPHPAGGAQETGRTVISETAVAKVAAIAARSVHGVHALGSGAARSLGAIRDVVGATDLTQGVRAEVGETQVAVDVNLIAEYGVPLQLVADGVRAAVYAAVEDLVGLSVIEVNVEINDVHIPTGDPDRAATRPRHGEHPGALPNRPAIPVLGHPGRVGEAAFTTPEEQS